MKKYLFSFLIFIPVAIFATSFPVGQFNGDTGNVPAWNFTGTNTGTGLGGFTVIPTPSHTGRDAVTMQDVGTYLEWYADGVFLMDFGKGIPGQGEMTIAGDVVPYAANYKMGRTNSPWPIFAKAPIEVEGVATTRAVVLKAGGEGGNVVGYGLDMSDDYGAAYFQAYDTTTNLLVSNVWSVKVDNGITTEKLGDTGGGGIVAGDTSLTLQATTSGVVTIGKDSTTRQNAINNLSVAASNCGSIAGAAGCLQMTINGSTHYVPYV